LVPRRKVGACLRISLRSVKSASQRQLGCFFILKVVQFFFDFPFSISIGDQ
jgi:hypothetical protein